MSFFAGIRVRRTATLFFLGALPSLLFAIYTRHAWEDWFITFRAAKNLATGNGLVFQPGQILQTFTSPLNVMIPAGLSWITGSVHDELVLWLYRLICIALLGATTVLLDRIARQQGLSRPVLFLLPAFFLCDAKIMDFSINGQEAAFMMFFLVLQLVALLERRELLLGFAWGGLMWSRPDSFVYIGGAVAGYLLHLWLNERSHLVPTLRLMGRSGLMGALIYAPWLVGTTWYYGSPVPHTIIAKGLLHTPDLTDKLVGLLVFPIRCVVNIPPALLDGFAMPPSVLNDVFMPSYYVLGGWPDGLVLLGRVLACLAVLAWMLPGMSVLVRICSLAAFAGTYYLQIFPAQVYPWYLPSCALMCIVTLAGLLELGLQAARNNVFLRRSLLGVAATAVLVWFGVALCMAREMRVQQALIESGQRKQIGLWLKQHAVTAQDTVFLECLGYIGFYSNLKMYDFPGMSSPEMVAARRLNGDWWPLLIGSLHPDWLVLRAGEVSAVAGEVPEHYRLMARFDQSAAVAAVAFLPGRGYLRFDQTFLVYHRIDAHAQQAPGAITSTKGG